MTKTTAQSSSVLARTFNIDIELADLLVVHSAVDRANQTVKMRLLDASIERMGHTGFVVKSTFDLKPGKYWYGKWCRIPKAHRWRRVARLWLYPIDLGIRKAATHESTIGSLSHARDGPSPW